MAGLRGVKRASNGCDRISVVKICGVDLAGQPVAATRFAPSPNGRLHIGHAFSALCAHDFARCNGGKFMLRIEDIDGSRSRAEHIEAILADMQWLGLSWDGDVVFQSQRIERYQTALTQLQDMGLLYRCWCSRSDIMVALKDRPMAHGPDGPVYPGTCKAKSAGEGAYSWRLDMAAAVARARELRWTDLVAGRQYADPMLFGDVVLWRKDTPASYHLAATMDDAADGISHIVRGQDLFAYTSVHRLLQVLLDLPEPLYWHHPLLLDDGGEKLAKSRSSEPLSALRDAGMAGQDLLAALRAGKLPIGIWQSGS